MYRQRYSSKKIKRPKVVKFRKRKSKSKPSQSQHHKHNDAPSNSNDAKQFQSSATKPSSKLPQLQQNNIDTDDDDDNNGGNDDGNVVDEVVVKDNDGEPKTEELIQTTTATTLPSPTTNNNHNNNNDNASPKKAVPAAITDTDTDADAATHVNTHISATKSHSDNLDSDDDDDEDSDIEFLQQLRETKQFQQYRNTENGLIFEEDDYSYTESGLQNPNIFHNDPSKDFGESFAKETAQEDILTSQKEEWIEEQMRQRLLEQGRVLPTTALSSALSNSHAPALVYGYNNNNESATEVQQMTQRIRAQNVANVNVNVITTNNNGGNDAAEYYKHKQSKYNKNNEITADNDYRPHDNGNDVNKNSTHNNHRNGNADDNGDGKTLEQELYSLPSNNSGGGGTKVVKNEALKGGILVDNEKGERWLQGMTEVELPIQYKLYNIQETEAAKQRLLQPKPRHERLLDIPRNYNQDFTSHHFDRVKTAELKRRLQEKQMRIQMERDRKRRRVMGPQFFLQQQGHK